MPRLQWRAALRQNADTELEALSGLALWLAPWAPRPCSVPCMRGIYPSTTKRDLLRFCAQSGSNRLSDTVACIKDLKEITYSPAR